MLSLKLFGQPRMPVKRTYGSWKMTVDYGELSKSVVSIRCVAPHTAPLTRQLIQVMGSSCAALDFANEFFSIP